jgi:hypothetical protein
MLMQKLLSKLEQPASSIKRLTWDGDLLRYKRQIWVGGNVSMHQTILQTLHESAIGGHSGVQATLQHVRQLFAWPKMRTTIQDFVDTCAVCKQAKPEHVKYPGLLKPLQVPNQAWKVVSLGFIDGLPKSADYTLVLVVVNKMTKYSQFLPLSHPYTSRQVAQLYLDHVFKLHGMPKALISD